MVELALETQMTFSVACCLVMLWFILVLVFPVVVLFIKDYTGIRSVSRVAKMFHNLCVRSNCDISNIVSTLEDVTRVVDVWLDSGMLDEPRCPNRRPHSYGYRCHVSLEWTMLADKVRLRKTRWRRLWLVIRKRCESVTTLFLRK